MSPTITASAAPLLPLRDFFRNAEQAGHQISPDGRFLSYTAPFERRMNVFVRPLAGGEATRVTSETARDISGYFWKGNRIVYVKDFGGDENFHVVVADLDGSALKDLTPGEHVRAEIVDDLEDDDDHLILSHNRRDPEVFDVYRVDLRTGAETLIAQNPGNITSWGTDHDGKLRVAGSTDGVDSTMLYRASEDDEFAPILTTNFKESVAPLFFTFDNKQLYVASNRGRDKTALFVFDPAAAQEGELLVESPEVDVEGLTYSRKRRVLTTARWVTAKTQRKFLDVQTEAMFRDVEAKLPGYEIEFTSADKAEDKALARDAWNWLAAASKQHGPVPESNGEIGDLLAKPDPTGKGLAMRDRERVLDLGVWIATQNFDANGEGAIHPSVHEQRLVVRVLDFQIYLAVDDRGVEAERRVPTRSAVTAPGNDAQVAENGRRMQRRRHLAHAAAHVLLDLVVQNDRGVDEAASVHAATDPTVEAELFAGQQHGSVQVARCRLDVDRASAGFAAKARLVGRKHARHVDGQEVALGHLGPQLFDVESQQRVALNRRLLQPHEAGLDAQALARLALQYLVLEDKQLGVERLSIDFVGQLCEGFAHLLQIEF